MKKLITLIAVVAVSAGLNAQTPAKTKPAAKSSTTTTPAKTSAPTKQSSTPAKTTNTTTTTTPAKKADEKPAENAGGRAFAKNDNIFNLGFGVGHFYGFFGHGVGYPSVNLSYERVIIDFADGKGAVGVGGMLGWWTGTYRYNNFFGSDYSSRYTYSNIAIGPRATVHYDLFEVPKLDTYAGLQLGVYINSTRYKYVDPNDATYNYTTHSSGVGVMYGFFVGARYYTGKSNKFGFFGELGYGLSVLRLGIALKL